MGYRSDNPAGSGPKAPTVTLADVAKRVGVSARTVSRVVNDEGGCTEETRQRILAAIDELGYRPNLMARGLTRRRSDTIGLVTAEMSDPFFPEFADGVERAAAALGRTMFLATSGGDRVRQQRALTSLVGHGVEGAIVFLASGSEPDLIRMASELPVVVVNSPIDGEGIGVVAADIQSGAQTAVEHLLHRGRQRVALLIVGKARTLATPSRREMGYRAAHEASGRQLNETMIIEVDNSLDGGRDGVRQALAMAEPPDAIFAYNDVIAIGAMQQCLAEGLSVPHDMAIVGFDDIMMCEAMTPALTTVRIDRDQLGRAAVEMLRHLADEGAVEPELVPVELIVRDSS